MKTYNGNIGNVMQNIGKITFDTLEKFNIPYDEIYFGKPYADFYIDDLAINAFENIEKGIGFYDNFIKEREFNNITIVKEGVKKIGNEKLLGEIYFYNNIPLTIKNYFPKLIESNDNEYIIEKINGINLSRLYITENINEEILLSLFGIMEKIHNTDFSYNGENIYLNYHEKIKNRFENYNYSVFNDYEKVYDKITNFLINYQNNNSGLCGIIHGDLVFSNILIDEEKNYKFIDMRGKLGNNLSIIGDIFYDYAKIYQSLIGYDEILLDEYVSPTYKKKLINFFENYIKSKFDVNVLNNIKMITNSLLFSLIPLHNDEKIYKYYKLIDC
jgi:hypothetical protein